jgi:peroxiredoxin
MKTFCRMAILVLALFMVGACAQTGAVEEGKVAPDISLKDTWGHPAKLSDHKGKVIILNFFGTWCPPCRAEIPDFIELQDKYAQGDFTFIGISNEDPREVGRFIAAKLINYPVWIDATGSAADAYGPIRGIPTTFVIGKDFKIKRKYIGARPGSVFENDIKELI